MANRPPREVARQVLEIESQAIRDLLPQLDGGFDRAVEMLRACRGRVVCTGMGKSGLVLQKVAATLSSTGTPAVFLHPAEAIHGDVGMVVEGDVVLAASNSGTTDELLRLVETLRRLDIPLVAITGKPGSPLARLARGEQVDALGLLAARSRVDLDLALQRVVGIGQAQVALAAAEERHEDLAEVLTHLRERREEELARRDVDLADRLHQRLPRVGEVGALGGEEVETFRFLLVLLDRERIHDA